MRKKNAIAVMKLQRGIWIMNIVSRIHHVLADTKQHRYKSSRRKGKAWIYSKATNPIPLTPTRSATPSFPPGKTFRLVDSCPSRCQRDTLDMTCLPCDLWRVRTRQRAESEHARLFFCSIRGREALIPSYSLKVRFIRSVIHNLSFQKLMFPNLLAG